MMVGGEKANVFLGLREDADVDKFHREAEEAYHEGSPMDIEQYVPSSRPRRTSSSSFPAGRPTAAARATWCWRSAPRPTSTRCVFMIGCAATATASYGRCT